MARVSARRAMTLVEVMVVTLCVVVAGAAAVPSLSRARPAAQLVECAQNLGTIDQALGSLQQDFPGFYAPMPDDSQVANEGQYRHFGRLATWIDVLQQRGYIASRDPGYCPADQLPDQVNENRGRTWGYKYPVALGGGYGVDHSYSVSMPYASAASAGAFPCWDPDGDPDKRVIAGDGWWPYMLNLSGKVLVSGWFDDPAWTSNMVGYRHKFAANLLHRDGHVVAVAYDVDASDYDPQCNESGVDTTQHFVWKPGESPYVGPSAYYNYCDMTPGCTDYPMGSAAIPNELKPGWYTVNHAWTIPDIMAYKGWTLP